MLSGLANLVLASSEEDDDTWLFQQASVENLFAAVVAKSAFGYVSPHSAARDRLLRAASQRIAERFRDRTFGIAALAAELSVSERSIQQAFAGTGTTAKKALTLVRLRDARELLRRAAPPPTTSRSPRSPASLTPAPSVAPSPTPTPDPRPCWRGAVSIRPCEAARPADSAHNVS
ncbi:hypothetical protein Q0F99_08100 [Rathayibacter oskolensis]|uniref:hypothetical protein n=1 Tax=Rathayibacter oskolensis TaxID=1891671 RepID=UPI00265D9E7A|nr:hypothetical protein [Rathayibacter oskolensis]WKK72832.1 hypothetical protein Q0F99_08100 [Rathayibacter oskolensis]